jgi:DNA polymerase-3 subunit epsilon
MLEQELADVPLTFLDVETTGLSPAHGHRICELALLRVRAGTIEYEFDRLIDPQRPLDPRAALVNGISPELLHGAPTFDLIAREVQEVIEDSVLVAHNAPFDMAFLEHEFHRLGLPAPTNYVLDTLRLARRLLQRSSYNLHALAYDLHLDTPAHRAMPDVLALRGLFDYLAGRMRTNDICTLAEVLRFQRGLLPGQAEPEPPPLIARAIHEGRCLRIVYRSRSTPEATERIVRPREVTRERRGIYLLAYCYLRQDQRLFAVDKIEAMELLDE